MRFDSVTFAAALASPGDEPPGDLPQIAFAGRSNVGKSSLINRLLGRTRTKVAHTSRSPGRTRQINLFRVESTADGEAFTFYLVDLPGYGYARVPEEMRQGWRPLIEHYMETSVALRGVVQLLDARHDPKRDDDQMIEYLARLGVPALFVLTKVDKLTRSERVRRLARTLELLPVAEEQVIAFSAKTGEGRDELLKGITELLSDE